MWAASDKEAKERKVREAGKIKKKKKPATRVFIATRCSVAR